MPRKLSFTSGRGQLVQGNPIRSALVEQILREQGRSPQFIPDAGTLGVNLGAELVRALTLRNAEKREQADREAAIKERQAARAPRRTEGVSLDFVNAPTDNRFASDLPAGEFGSEAERAALATQLNVENQSRPLNLSERLNVSNQAAGGPLRPGPTANQVPQITRNPTLREQASSLQNPRNAGLAEQLFATDTINQENLAQLVLRLQNQAGIAAQNRELTRRGQDISAKTRIDAANISANRPRPGVTEPLPADVQAQRLEIAKAEKERLSPLQAKQLEKLDREEKQAGRKVQSSFRSFERKSDNLISTIDKALGQINVFSAGTGGFLLNNLPSSDARDLSATLDTIRANVGFEELQSMRANSPTGGALGQVSENENKLLQSVQASLDQFQSADQLRQNLNTIKQLAEAVKGERTQAFQSDFGGLPTPQANANQQNRRKDDALSPEEEAELQQLRQSQ